MTNKLAVELFSGPGSTELSPRISILMIDGYILKRELVQTNGAGDTATILTIDPYTTAWFLEKAASGIIAWVAGQAIASLFPTRDPELLKKFEELVRNAVEELKKYIDGAFEAAFAREIQNSLDFSMAALQAAGAAPTSSLAKTNLDAAYLETLRVLTKVETEKLSDFSLFKALLHSMSYHICIVAALYDYFNAKKQKVEAIDCMRIMGSSIRRFRPKVEKLWSLGAGEMEAKKTRISAPVVECTGRRFRNFGRIGEGDGGGRGGNEKQEGVCDEFVGFVIDNGIRHQTWLYSGREHHLAVREAADLHRLRVDTREQERLAFDKEVGSMYRSLKACMDKAEVRADQIVEQFDKPKKRDIGEIVAED